MANRRYTQKITPGLEKVVALQKLIQILPKNPEYKSHMIFGKVKGSSFETLQRTVNNTIVKIYSWVCNIFLFISLWQYLYLISKVTKIKNVLTLWPQFFVQP